MGCAVSSEGSSMGASLRKKLKHSPANKGNLYWPFDQKVNWEKINVLL